MHYRANVSRSPGTNMYGDSTCDSLLVSDRFNPALRPRSLPSEHFCHFHRRAHRFQMGNI